MSADALWRRGLELLQAGQADGARGCLEAALAADPDCFTALHVLGALKAELGAHEEAAGLLRRAIAVDPAAAAPYCLLGATLEMLERPAEALTALDRAVVLDPNDAEAHRLRRRLLHDLGRFEAAVQACDRILALEPAAAEIHYNRGLALQMLGQPQAAIQSYDRALAFRPTYGLALNNRGLAHYQLGRPDEALASYDRAIATDPDFADAHLNRSFALLQTGRLEEGWRAYEWRKRAEGWRDLGSAGGVPWSGSESLAGRRIHVWREQGFGDLIQFSRYALLLEQMGAEVFLSVHEPLRALMRSLSPTLTLLGDDNPPRTCDFQCALMSLPLLFGTTLQTVPAFERYLAPEAERLERMAHLLGPRTRPRVGLAWSGNSANKNDLFRSIAFARLAPLFGGEIEWIVAQNVVRPSDAPALAESPEVRFLGHELADFADTAALVAQCDLVISADTSIAHLAGALGKPVWVLLPLGCDWRWLKDRSDSPWYPTARLFRQPRLGDWESVVDAARRALPAALGVGLA